MHSSGEKGSVRFVGEIFILPMPRHVHRREILCIRFGAMYLAPGVDVRELHDKEQIDLIYI